MHPGARVIRISAVLLSPFVYLIGRVQGNFTVMYMASLIILICNISFSFEKVRDRIAFLCFNGTFFLFLTARPLTCILRNIQWTNIGYSYDADLFAVTMIYVSLLTLYVSARLTTIDNSLDTIVREEQSIFIKNIQFVSFIFFIIGFVCSMMEGMERILFMQTHTYVDIYTGEYRTSMPAVVKGFIQIMKPCMCIFLATLPSKRKSCFVLAAYLFSTLPSLRVGMRSPTMLACVFIFVYYVLRDALRKPNEIKWFGKVEKTIVVILLPFVICFLLIYTELRNGYSSNISSKMQNPIVNFLYEQSTTYNALVKFWDVKDKLPQLEFPGYLFGYAYDVFFQNGIISGLTGVSFPVGQTMERLLVSHDLKLHLSYAVSGDMFFQGHGIGTSYVLDVFVDYSWIGVIIFNVIIGWYLNKVKYLLSKHWILSAMILYSLLTIFYIPRSTALEPFVFILSPYFWLGIAICFIGALLITPKTYQNESKYIGRIHSKYIK